jgi:hypothetical protein
VAARALFAAPGALRALRTGRRGGTVELVLSGGAYLRLEEDWLLVAEAGAVFGPLSIAVAGLERSALQPGQRVSVREERLKIGNQGVSLARVRERRPAYGGPTRSNPPGAPAGRSVAGGPNGRSLAGGPAGRTPGDGPAGRSPGDGPAGRSSGGLESCSPAGGPTPAPFGAPPVGLAPGLRALARGRVEPAVQLLAGRGDGLTPAGDDALAGYAAWRHSTGRPVAISGLAAGRSSPLGLAYLRCAERGELPGAGVALLAALRSGDPAHASAAARTLRGWGASSGAAMLWGIAAGAQLEGFILDCPPIGWAGQDGSRCRRGRGPF